jgi:mono/diheme cytochrome c family protein
MKTVALQKLITHSLYFLFGIVFSLQFIQCNESDTKGDIGYGKSFFIKNCASCHQWNNGYKGAPGLLVLNSYDSLTLFNKLHNFKQDSVHGNYFKDLKYTNKEVNSIYKYIRYTFEPHY